jgi:hypothetical protein
MEPLNSFNIYIIHTTRQSKNKNLLAQIFNLVTAVTNAQYMNELQIQMIKRII